MKAPIIAVLGLLSAYSGVATCNAASVSDLKSMIEGVYILDE